MSEPLDAISKWQEWYRANRVIAQIDTPGASKDSRESLHDTSNVTADMPEWQSMMSRLALMKGLDCSSMDKTVLKAKAKATEQFADTLAEFFNELSGAELFECFLTAAYNNAELVKKDYDKAQELVDLLRCKQ